MPKRNSLAGVGIFEGQTYISYEEEKDGGWERITWDYALDTIAQKFQEIKDKYGARALAVYTGSLGTENIELAAYAQRFRGVYGTPNLLSVEGNCFRSRIMARQMTFGGTRLKSPGMRSALSSSDKTWTTPG